jgi:broad specificity phosphatase PhoE
MVWRIPATTTRWMNEVPANRPVVLLLRHSVRPDLPPNDAGYTTLLTDDGVRLAEELGTRMGPALRSLHTSPFPRCVQTAEALRAGAGADLSIRKDHLLGDPGIYIVDNKVAGPIWKTRGHETVMSHLVEAHAPLPGMASPPAAARFLVHHMLAAATEPGLHVFVTHDSLITATAAHLLGIPFGKDAWPWYLEAAVFWREEEQLHSAYRDHTHVRRDALCSLDDLDVLELARREVTAVVGPNLDARFFLAGGAFKTLLTGAPPRDLDLWAASPDDRTALLTALLARGARPLEPRPYCDAFELHDRVVEVPHKAEPTTLEELLARFDLGLSAVGVEHRPGGYWRTVVHPLAHRSVARREVLLLKPLVNWRHALATLVRLRRYAAELGFVVPPKKRRRSGGCSTSNPVRCSTGCSNGSIARSSANLGFAKRHAVDSTDLAKAAVSGRR